MAMAATIAPAAGQGQSGQPAGAPAPQARSLKSQAEQQALRRVVPATTNDARIRAAEDFITGSPSPTSWGWRCSRRPRAIN